MAGMLAPIRVKDIVAKASISKGYASDILAGKRAPSLPLAIRMYRELGVKLGPIASFSAAEIGQLEKMGVKRLGATA